MNGERQFFSQGLNLDVSQIENIYCTAFSQIAIYDKSQLKINILHCMFFGQGHKIKLTFTLKKSNTQLQHRLIHLEVLQKNLYFIIIQQKQCLLLKILLFPCIKKCDLEMLNIKYDEKYQTKFQPTYIIEIRLKTVLKKIFIDNQIATHSTCDDYKISFGNQIATHPTCGDQKPMYKYKIFAKNTTILQCSNIQHFNIPKVKNIQIQQQFKLQQQLTQKIKSKTDNKKITPILYLFQQFIRNFIVTIQD
eukprot:TRINITY_DN4033_c0_g2_i1.p1 TRINITY_DN4033_c0_g2~~TRINITY_DN4033_c0_g2_i1.p1  ORF type:complete len:249 (+),score=-10.52 TRINITY_DN4033_c0_g2_i1:428-1174(+)